MVYHFLIRLMVFCLLTVQASAYVIQTDFNTRDRIVQVHWPFNQARSGINFFLNAGSFPFGEQDVVRIVEQSFGAWNAVSTSYLQMNYQGTTRVPASNTDRRNVVVYDATGQAISAPAGSGIIAITRVNWNDDGEISDADIIFNGRDFQFSVSEDTTPSRQIDLQDVLTHETGHFLGLDHTPLVGDPLKRPTMNPFNTSEAPREGRSLEDDDRAGVTALYPVGTQTGGIAGQVLKADGSGAFGVHVVAYWASTRTFVASALSGSAGGSMGRGGDGRYEILGLPIGDYHVAIVPHDRSISSENFGGIFQETFDTDFDLEFYDNTSAQSVAQTVQVIAGQSARNINFALGLSVPGSPFIQLPNFPANTPDPNGPYRFSVQVTDDVGITGVELHYRVNEGSVQVAQMRRGVGDVYTVDLAGQRQGSVVDYRVVARDGDGNLTALPAQNLPMIRFEVLALSGSPVAYVAVRGAQAVLVIDTGPGIEVARIPTGETPLSVLMTPDERYLFVANTGSENAPDNRITVIETATHRVAKTIAVGTAPLDLAVSKDGQRVYATNSQGRTVSVIDVPSLTEQTLRVLTSGTGPFGVAVGKDGSQVFVTDIEVNQVLVLDASDGAILARINVVSSPRSLAISPDGARLYVAGFDGNVSVVNTQTQTVVQTVDTGTASVFRVAVSPDGTRVYATDRQNGQLLVIDTAQFRVTNTISVLADGNETRDLFVSPDGNRIYVTNQNSDDLVVFDAATLRILRSFQVSDGPRGVAVRSRPFVFEPTVDVAGKADFNASGTVDFGDFLMFVGVFGLSASDSGFDVRFDLDDDQRVNFSDFLLFAGVFGRVVNP